MVDVANTVEDPQQTTAVSETPTAAAGGQLSGQPAPALSAAPVPTAQQGPTLPSGGSTPHRSFMADMLHAVGDILAGPSTAKVVDPKSGAIVSVPLSREQRIANRIAVATRGAAAGLAQHGPGHIGKAGVAGFEQENQIQQQNKNNLLAESANVRATNEAKQRDLLNQATLAKMSQEQAAGALNLKFKGMELDENQTKLAEGMQEILNIPGAKLLQHFDSNDEINAHLEAVGPQLAKQYAIDLSKNNIRLVQNPKGGFDAVEVPKGQGETPIGEGHKLYTYTPKFDPKTKKTENVLTETEADPAMTWDKYQTWNGTTMSGYNAAIEAQQKQEETRATIAKEKAQTAEAYANAHKAIAETGIKGDDEMIDKGRNPFTGKELTINNAPDTMMVDGEGRPIPFKMLPAMKPSQNELNRADFANSVMHSLESIDKLKAEGKLPNGPLTGFTKEKLAKLGLGEKDAQEAINLISLTQSAATGAHVGGRFATTVLEKMQGLLQLNMNSDQFQGAEDSIRDVMGQYVKTGGRHTVAQWKQDHAVYATAPGKPRQVSYDGGKTWLPAPQ